MDPQIIINIKKGEGLGCVVSYEIANGIRVVNALSALESLIESIKEKSLQHATKEGLDENNTDDEKYGFFANQMLEELF